MAYDRQLRAWGDLGVACLVVTSLVPLALLGRRAWLPGVIVALVTLVASWPARQVIGAANVDGGSIIDAGAVQVGGAFTIASGGTFTNSAALSLPAGSAGSPSLIAVTVSPCHQP